MQIINAKTTSPLIPLGYQGENHSRQIVFDIADWQKLYGSGSVLLAHQRGGDVQPYPVAVTVEGGKAIWTVQSADVAVPGNAGHCQLSYLVDDKVVKSMKWRTEVYPSLGATTAVPAPYQLWMDAIREELLQSAPLDGDTAQVDGTTLVIENGIMRVNTTDTPEEDNTQPITSKGVQIAIGNINALLEQI